MIGYLSDHESYSGWNHPYRKWSPLSWDVKLSPNYDGKRGECKTDDALDDEWDKHVTSSDGQHIWDWIVEDMRCHYTEGTYCTYPGDDQGNWKFCFAGRSGGHMLLEEWKYGKWNCINFLKGFYGVDTWTAWLEGQPFGELRTLYRAVRCMDADFTREKMNREFEYQLNFRRHEWEEDYRRNESFSKAEQGIEPCPAI